MGGDKPPSEIVAGARQAMEEGLSVVLVGRPDAIGDVGDIPVIEATEVIAMDDEPGNAVRTKKDSSLKLLDYLAKPATQLSWYSINGDLPTTNAALTDPTMTADPLVAVYSKQLKAAKIRPPVPNWDGGLAADLPTAPNRTAR